MSDTCVDDFDDVGVDSDDCLSSDFVRCDVTTFTFGSGDAFGIALTLKQGGKKAPDNACANSWSKSPYTVSVSSMIVLHRVGTRINDGIRAVKYFVDLGQSLMLFYEFLLYVLSGNRGQWVGPMDLLKMLIISNKLTFVVFCFVY